VKIAGKKWKGKNPTKRENLIKGKIKIKQVSKNMAILKTRDARKQDMAELDKKVRELRLEIAKEKANIAIGAPVSSPGKMREMKKTIARILTIKRENVS
jgi:large subunit ribosomal protein L29